MTARSPANHHPPVAAHSGYWATHRTIVITWKGTQAGVPAIGRHRRLTNGDLAVEYTRDDLVLAVTIMRELRGEQEARPVVGRQHSLLGDWGK